MNLDHYRNFVTIVDEGSLTRAAEKLHVVQSALSQQLQMLERHFGTKLLLVGRGLRTMRLTDAGWIFYKRAKELCQLDDDTAQEIDNCAKGLSGTLVVGIVPSRTSMFAKRYCEPFARKYPHINYELHEESHLVLLDEVLKGNVEIGIASAVIPGAYRFDILYERAEQFCLVGRKDNPWLDLKRPITDLHALATIPLLITRAVLDVLAPVLAEREIAVTPRLVCALRETTLQFARENLGLAAMPLEHRESIPRGMAACPVKDERLKFSKTIYKLKGRPLSMGMRKFLEVYDEELKQWLHES